jgi:hypothetical protein
MSKEAEILKELDELVREGTRILGQVQGAKKIDHFKLGLVYESWYTKALAAISQLIPQRQAEFVEAYRREKRRQVDAETYTIGDFLIGLSLDKAGQPVFDTKMNFAAKMLRQITIVQAALQTLPSVLRNVRGALLAELLDSDITTGRELLRSNHFRSAGAVAGVVLEKHFRAVAIQRGLTMMKKSPTIAEFNELLKEANVYDVPTWRLVQRLADIRNLCVHNKDREPTPDEVADLLNGVDKVIKEVF